jgi:hypothetical protein
MYFRRRNERLRRCFMTLTKRAREAPLAASRYMDFPINVQECPSGATNEKLGSPNSFFITAVTLVARLALTLA